MAINWGEAFKIAGPVLGNMAQGKTVNRAYENQSAVDLARLQEQAALNRAQIALSQGNLDINRQRDARDAEMQAIRNAMTAGLMKNMGDVSIDRSGFRSKVPTLSFGGGSRPSALGPDRGGLADVINNRAMQALMSPPPPSSSSEAVPRGGDGAMMPAYMPPEQKGGGFWENALGMAGLGSSVAGALMKKAAPAAAANAGGNYVQQGVNAVANRFANAPATTAAMTGPLGSTPVTMSAPTGVADGVSGALGLASKGPSIMSQINQLAGPAAFGLGIASNFAPPGKARTAMDWASKGAQAGSFIPGVGTGIGAAAGAVAGAIKGHQNATKGQREDFAKNMGYRTLDQLYKALDAMGPEGQELKNRALNVIGKQDTKGNQQWMGQVQYLLGRR